ncbi:SMC family ATPase, partial [Rhodococcus sp. CSLK01-03]
MRLHQLEVTAFGPFAETVRVDFDELGADGLFLLHGRTGAGKTSILDAVAFALYGTVPGARADGRRLLSDHAPAGTAPQVGLEATIAGRRLRIVRSPDYERPKLRGTGTVKQNAKASLTWLDGSGEHLSRLPDIAEAVRRLLGMSAEQFFQVVLLPQGEFAKFLRADSEDRGKLLERLFDTTRFGSVERWFKDRRSAAATRLEEQQRAVDLLLAKVSAAAGLEAGADAEPVVWAHRLRDDAAENRDLALAALDRARADDTRDRAALAEATELRRCQERRARAVAELAELDAAAAELQSLTAELETARRAAPVVEIARDARRAAEAAATAHAAAVDAAAPLAADREGQALVAELDGSPADTDRGLIRPHEQRWSAEVVRLDGLLEQEERLIRLEADRAALQRQRRDLVVRAERIAVDLDELPNRRDAAEQAARASEQAAATLPRLEAELTRTSDALAAATELRDLVPQLQRLEDEVAARRDAHLDARTALLDVRERRIAGMAAELATDLADGHPCGVCGATAHPSPARPAPDTPTKTAED